MENKYQNTTPNDGVGEGVPLSSSDALHEPPPDSNALSSEPQAMVPLPSQEQQPKSRVNIFLRFARRIDVILIALLLIGAVGVFYTATRGKQQNDTTGGTNSVASRFGTVQLPLSQLISGKNLTLSGAANVTINGQLQLSDSLYLAPTLQPTGAKPGQIYFDKNTDQLAYFNGQNFVFLTNAPAGGLQSLGGATGAVILGNGLTVANNQLANNGVLSVQGQSGNVTLTAGPGLLINGTNFSNSGVISISAATPNVTVTKDASGNVALSVASAGGTVTSSGGTNGTIPVFTTSQNIENSIISQSGMTAVITGDLSIVTGGLSLSNALTVSNGGTGAKSLAANGILVGQGTAPITSVTAASAGLCLVSTAGAPVWGACSSGTGVTSLNGLSGGLSIANASGAGTTITIDDASTTAKGIASFNATNFTVAAGAVNTIQNINSGATPTFAGLNTNIITPSGAMTVGATGQALTLQGSAATVLSATSGANTTTLSFAAPTANVTYQLQSATAGTYSICTTAGNCATPNAVTSPGGTTNALAKFTGAQIIGDSIISDNGTTASISGALSVSTTSLFTGQITANGNITSSGALSITSGGAGALTIGSATQQLILQGNSSTQLAVTSGVNSTNVTFVTPTANVTYRFATAAAGTYDICSTAGNCAGSGGGVTTPGGTTNAIPKFTGAQTIGSSSITDNGTTVTTSENAVIQGGTLTVGVAATSTGTINLTHSASSFVGTIVQGSLTGNRTYTLPDVSGTICTSAGNCSGAGSSNTLQAAYDAGNTIATSTGRDISFTLANTLTPSNFTVTIATGSTSTAQILRANGAGTADPAQLLLLGNQDTARAVPVGLKIQSASGGITTAIDLTDANIGTALSVGAHNISGTTGGLSFTNFSIAGSTGNITTNGTINGQTISSTAAFTGSVGITSGLTVGGSLAANGGNITSTGALNITPGGTMTVGVTGQQLILQGNASTQLTATSGGFTTTVGFANVPTANVSYNFDRSVAAGTYTICTTIGNCSSVGGGVTTPGGTTGTLPVFTGAQTLGNSLLSQSGSTVTVNGNINLATGNTYQINGTQISSANLSNDANLAKLSASETFTGNTVAFQNALNSTNAFNIQNAAGNRILTGDTTNGQVILGTASALNGQLVFNNVSNANTVTIVPGSITANRTLTLPDATGVICTSSGNCAGAGATLQTAYNFSTGGTTPKIKLNSTLLGLDIQDADTTIGADLFDVRASNALGLGSVLFGVGNTGQVTLQNSANSTTALRLLSQGGTAVLTGDTTNGRVLLGQSGTLTGNLVFANSSGANTISLTSAAASANQTITLPNASGTICLTAGNCSGAGSSNTLQAAYDAGNTITTSTGRDIAFTLAASATPGNFITNLQCASACGSNGRFAIQNSGTDVFTVSPAGGAITIQPTVNTASSLDVKTSIGNNIFTVDTANNRVGVGLGGSVTPVLAGAGGIDVKGALRLEGGSAYADTYTTPAGSNISSMINIPNYDPGAFGQLVAMGLPSTANATARAISLLDARTVAHQATLAIFSPTENDSIGLNWNGSNNFGNLQTIDRTSNSTAGIIVHSGNISAGDGTSGTVYLESGAIAGGTTAGNASGDVVLQSGSAAGNAANSGSVRIDVGTASGTKGTIQVGNVNANSILIGNGTVGTAVNVTAGTGGITLATGASSTGASGSINIDAGANVPTGTLLTSKTFEAVTENMAPWFGVASTTSSTAQAHGGTHSLAAVENATSWGIQENYPGTTSVTPGHVYAFSAWVRGTVAEAITAKAVFVGSGASAATWSTVTDTTTGWTQMSGNLVAPTGSTTVYTEFISSTGTGTATDYFDDITYTDVSTTTAPAINIGTTNAQAVTIGNANQTAATTLQGGAGGVSVLAATGANITIKSTGAGNNYLKSDTSTIAQSTTNNTIAFQVQNAASSSVFDVDTTNGRVGIGTNAPTRPLSVSVNNASQSAMPLLLGQSGTGNTGLELQTASQNFYMGIDNTDSKFKIASAASANGTVTLGDTTVEGSSDFNSNGAQAYKVTAASTGAVSSMSFYITSLDSTPSNRMVQVGVYTDNGSGTSPSTLIGSSTAQTATLGWNTITLPGVNLTSGTIYWIALAENGANQYAINGGGGVMAYHLTTGYPFPSSFAANAANSTNRPSFYVTMVSTGSTNNFGGTNLLTLSDTGQTTFRNSANSTTGFQIQNQSASSIFTADTSNMAIDVNGAASTGTLNTVGGITAASLSAPSTITITQGGTAGSTTYSYNVYACDDTSCNYYSAPGSKTTTTGNATLSGTNYNTVTWSAVNGAREYMLYRTAGAGSPAWLGTTTALTFNDTGSGFGFTAPTTATSGSLVTAGNASIGNSLSVTGTTTTGTLSVTNNATVNGILNVGGSTVLTANAPSDIEVQGGLSANTLSVPSSPSIAIHGTTGSTTYTYYVAACSTNCGNYFGFFGQTTPASSGTSTSSGNATLSSTNYNQVSWTAVQGAAGYAVYRLTGGVTSLVGVVNYGATSYNDVGTNISTGISLPTVDQTGNIQAAYGQFATLDTALTAATLNIGTNNASAIALNKATTVTGNFTVSGGTSYSLASSSSGSMTSSGAITITAGGGSTWSTSSGNLTIQAATTNALNLQTGGAGTINVGVNNTTAINIGNNSNNARSIGIGNTGGSQAQTIVVGNTGGASTTTIQGGTAGITLTSTGSTVVKQNTTATTTAFQVQNVAGTSTYFDVDALNGRVGIGTAAPSAQLDVVGQVPTATVNTVFASNSVYSMLVQGKYMYTGNFGSIQAFDISNATTPVSMGTVSVTGGITVLGGISGHYLYGVVTSWNELEIVDISNPNTMTKTAISSISGLNSVAVQGHYLYAATSDTSNNFKIFDISNPTSPTLVSTISEAAGNNAVTVSGRYAYILQSTQLHILDVSNPAAPVDMGSVAAGGATGQLVIRGKYVFSVGSGTLAAFDVSNPSTPTSVSTFSLTGTTHDASDIKIQGRYAYVALNDDNDVQIVNINNPASMTNVGIVNNATRTYGVGVNGRYMYAADTSSGKLDVYDVGGTYTQQLESGGIDTTSLNVTGMTVLAGQVNAVNGLSIGGGLNVEGGASIAGITTLTAQVNSTASFQVLNASSVSLFTVDTTDARVYVGNPTADSTGALLVLDTKNTAGDPTGVAGGMYYNSVTNKARCYDYNYWRDCTKSARTTYYYDNDMLGTTADSQAGYYKDSIPSGSFSTQAGQAGHPGITQLSTGTATNGYSAVGANDTGQSIMLGNSDTWRFEAELTIPTLSNGTDSYAIRAGLFNSAASDGTNGCFFKYSDSVNGGKWEGICENASTQSVCDTGITVAAATWYKLTVMVTSSAATFYVNGNSTCQVTTNIPSTNATSWNVAIGKTAGTTARTFSLDYVEVEGQMGTSR